MKPGGAAISDSGVRERLEQSSDEMFGEHIRELVPQVLRNSGDDLDAEGKQILMRQYEIYLEMTDRISQRRDDANRYMYTLCSGLAAVAGYLISSRGSEVALEPWGVALVVSLAGGCLTVIWARLILSYKHLNSGKFKVVHAFESLLPVRPYKAEWTALGEGRREALYLPLTALELRVPWVFFALFFAGVVVAGGMSLVELVASFYGLWPWLVFLLGAIAGGALLWLIKKYLEDGWHFHGKQHSTGFTEGGAARANCPENG